MARSSNSSSRHRLANQILEVIRDARFEPGHHMREQQLSDLLGVSRTPVRAALTLLAEQGIVEARRHQGFFLLVPFNDLHRTEIEVPSSVEQDLYERLVRDRLAGKLPASLTQSEIGQRYNVDRLAMLRTLARLAEDGLVARNKGHGWSFLPALDTHFALRSSYDFRLTIEPAAFLLGTFKADAAALKRVRLQHMYLVSHPDIASVGSAQLFDTDAAFHETMAEFSNNIFHIQAVQQQNRLRRLLEFGGYGNRRRVTDWCREHLAIIDAVSEGALATAAQLMHDHLSHAYGAAPDLNGQAQQAAPKRTKSPSVTVTEQ